MSTINQLNGYATISGVSGSDLLAVYSQVNGDARKLSLTNFVEWLATQQLATTDNKVTQYSAPSATGFTTLVTDSSNSIWLILTPTGAFANGAITLPTLANCVDKQEVLVNCTQAVTTFAVNGNGATVTGAPTTLAANGFFRMRFEAVMSTWYRVG